MFFTSEFDKKVNDAVEMAQKLSSYHGGFGAAPTNEGFKQAFLSTAARGLGNMAARAIGVPSLEAPIKLASSLVPAAFGLRNIYQNIQGADAILREQLESGQMTPEEYTAAIERLKSRRNSRMLHSLAGAYIGSKIGSHFSRSYPRVFVRDTYL